MTMIDDDDDDYDEDEGIVCVFVYWTILLSNHINLLRESICIAVKNIDENKT